jgi:DNA-binding NtrC family response regulator
VKARLWIGQIVHDRTRPASKGAAIVVGTSKRSGQFRICRWRGTQQHWSLPIVIDGKQLEPIADWTLMPLTEAKRLASAAFERNYLAYAIASAKGSLMDAARLAGVDRSNFRRLLQRHGLVRMPPQPKRQRGRRSK